MPTHQHVNGGQRLAIPAQTYNAMVDAANAHARGALSMTPGAAGLPPLLPGQVYVKNTTGATRKRFEVLVANGLSPATTAKSNPLVSTHNISNSPVVLGITPVPGTDAHHARVLVLDAPARADQIVPAYASGVCVARLAFTNGNGDAAEIDAGHQLKNVHSGPLRIIAIGQPSTERLALVDLCGFGTWRTVITAIEATDTQLRYKTRQVRVIGEQTESDWQNLLEYEPCNESGGSPPPGPL